MQVVIVGILEDIPPGSQPFAGRQPLSERGERSDSLARIVHFLCQFDEPLQHRIGNQRADGLDQVIGVLVGGQRAREQAPRQVRCEDPEWRFLVILIVVQRVVQRFRER